MKCRGWLMAWLLASAQAFGQTPAPGAAAHHFGLDAEPSRTGGRAQVENHAATRETFDLSTGEVAQTVDLADRRTENDRATIQVTVRNFDETPGAVRVEWFFVAHPIAPGAAAHDFIFDRGSHDLNLAGSAQQQFTVTSRAVQSQVTKLDAETYAPGYVYDPAVAQKLSGAKLQGWIIRLVDAAGKVLAVKASNDEFEDVARDDQRLRAMFPASSTRRRAQ